MNTNCLFLGPATGAITGQSKAFNALTAGIPGAKVIDFGERSTKIIFFLKAFLFFSRYRPSVVYFTSSRSLLGFARDFWIVLLAKVFGAEKVVNHLHGADFVIFRDSAPPLVRRVIDWTYSSIDHSIVLAEQMTAQYACYKTMKVSVIPNFYDPEEVLDTQNNFRNDPRECLNVLYLSNLMASKGIFELIEACELYKKRFGHVHLRIAGTPMSDHLMKGSEVMELLRGKLSSFISYEGTVKGSTKAELLRWAHVLCLPTYYPTEAQPISLIEGLAAGCFLVSTKQGYIESIFDQRSGAFVEPRSPESIYSALVTAAQFGERLNNISIDNSSIAMNKFSLKKYIESIKRIIEGTS